MKALVLVIAATAATSVAAADPLDELGFGAPATATANSRTAAATGAEAAHASPAGVALTGRPELLVGYQDSVEHLTIDGQDAGVIDARGTSLGIAIPFAIDGVRFGAAVAAYLPDQFLARILLTPIAEPRFVRLESAPHRTVVEPVLAVAIGHLAIGAGVSLLADARSRDLTFDVGVAGGDKQGAAHLDVALPVRAAPLAGIRWRPRRALAVAATFRGELSLDLALDLRANVDVPGVVTGDATVSLRSVSYFTPMRAAIAAAYQPREDLTLTADVSWERWSALGSGVPDLRVLLALDLSPPLVSSMHPPARFHDIITPRVGATWETGPWRLRAGAAYLPSPVPAQTGITSFADGARTLAAAGAGVRIPATRTWRQPIDLDVALTWQHVGHMLVRKDITLQPGGAFSSGGDVVQASVSSTVRF